MSKSVAAFLLLLCIKRSTSLLTGCAVERRTRRIQLSLRSSTEAPTECERLDTAKRIFCLSDLHTDSAINMRWLEHKCTKATMNDEIPGKGDLLVVAGDIAHELSCVTKTIEVLQQLQCDIFFVPGNHEAWLTSSCRAMCIEDSVQKLQVTCEMCRQMGVYTNSLRVGGDSNCPVWVVPMQGWYDGTLSVKGCEAFCNGFSTWPWTDFSRCQWPHEFPPRALEDENARIPKDLTEYLIKCNEPDISSVQRELGRLRREGDDRGFGVMTVSHFLPNQQCLPDWKDVDSPEFLRDEWLDHGAPQISAKFAKVAGSDLLDEQLRSLVPKTVSNVRHLHVFGHSHRPKDFDFKGVRYIHNPLGKPKERDMHMVDPNVGFQLIWDTSTGEVAGEQIIRYWEEKGGGKEALLARRAKSKADIQKVLVSATQSKEQEPSSKGSRSE